MRLKQNKLVCFFILNIIEPTITEIGSIIASSPFVCHSTLRTIRNDPQKLDGKLLRVTLNQMHPQ